MIMYGVIHKECRESFEIVLLGLTKQEAISLWEKRNSHANYPILSKKDGWGVYKFNVEVIE